MVNDHIDRLPFPALVGLEKAQQALMLLAVDPRLGGVALAAAAGTGKSSLARGLNGLLGGPNHPFLELPPHIDIENLLGGLDLEATLRTGSMVIQPGVLARAHNGTVYVDGLNLLSNEVENLLLSVIDQGEVVVEREGVGLRSAARFNLIGSYDPAEGLPRLHLLDRIGLLVTLPNSATSVQRAAVVQRNLAAPWPEWDEELAFMQGLVQTAREHLPQVTIAERQIRELSVLALKYGVEGHRVDLFAVRAACAAAALALRDSVEEEDLLLAAQFVIVPRATQIPDSNAEPPPPPPSPSPQPPPPEADRPEQEQAEGEGKTEPAPAGLPVEQLFEALETILPEELEQLPFQMIRRGRAGSRGATEGSRGRHIRSIPGDPRRARLDVVATLKAAAVWQRLRAPDESKKKGQIQLRLSDVRVKQYRSKAAALFCFAIDASGSMALHRMRQAKGAVQILLQKAYVNRDRVALIAFRGTEAELLLAPTQSVELARRALDILPTGGGTPLASALLLADKVAQQAVTRGIMQTALIVLTDGRGNVSVQEGANISEELQQIGRVVAASPVQTVIVDTQQGYLSRGEARRLAGWVGGRYAHLPNASSENIAQLAQQIIGNE